MIQVAQIRQDELKDYKKLKDEIETAEAKLAALRQKLIDQGGMGATVEPGPLLLEIQASTRSDVSTKLIVEEVAKRYGEGVAKEMKTAATKKVEFSRVVVKESGFSAPVD